MKKCQENSLVFKNLFGICLFWQYRLLWHNFKTLKNGELLQAAPQLCVMSQFFKKQIRS